VHGNEGYAPAGAALGQHELRIRWRVKAILSRARHWIMLEAVSTCLALLETSVTRAAALAVLFPTGILGSCALPEFPQVLQPSSHVAS
jgi:hypothetical protein